MSSYTFDSVMKEANRLMLDAEDQLKDPWLWEMPEDMYEFMCFACYIKQENMVSKWDDKRRRIEKLVTFLGLGILVRTDVKKLELISTQKRINND